MRFLGFVVVSSAIALGACSGGGEKKADTSAAGRSGRYDGFGGDCRADGCRACWCRGADHGSDGRSEDGR